MPEVHDDPSTVTAERGTVIVDGPNAVVVTLTPDVALDTADRLIEAATEAEGYRIMCDIRHADTRNLRG